MRISATTSVSVVALAAVAVLGAQYAGATQSSNAPAAEPNIAYLYSTQDNRGTGQVYYTIPNPPPGAYLASYTANFYPKGTPGAPVTFSCFLLKNGALRSQSTTSTTYTSGFFAAVNGANSVNVAEGDTFQAGCGLAADRTWRYGPRALQVSFTRTDGLVNLPLGASEQQGQLLQATTTR